MTNEEQIKCNECGDVIINDNVYTFEGRTLCRNCLLTVAFCCDRCAEWINRSGMNSNDNGDYCDSCYDPSEDEQQQEEDYEVNIPFQKLSSETFKQNPFKNFCGIELETTNNNLSENHFNQTELTSLGFNAQKDGSIEGNGGLEFSSLAFNGDLFLERVKKFCDLLNQRGYGVNTSCGHHLHIEVPKSVNMVKKILLYYNRFEDQFFRMMPKSRRENSYCKKINEFYGLLLNTFDNLKKIDDFRIRLYERTPKRIKSLVREKWHEKRYAWINLHSIFYRGTLEIRLHSGTTDYNKIKNWALLHLHIVNKLQKMSEEDIKKMPSTDQGFLSFFKKKQRTYIKHRWAMFSNIPVIAKNMEAM